MEGYKSLREAVMSVKGICSEWTYTASGETFTIDEMIQLGEAYDKQYPADGWNYFVSFPDGTIGILSTDDNYIVPFFSPVVADAPQEETAPQPEPPQEKPKSTPKFCRFCGTSLRQGAKFCPSCGKNIN